LTETLAIQEKGLATWKPADCGLRVELLRQARAFQARGRRGLLPEYDGVAEVRLEFSSQAADGSGVFFEHQKGQEVRLPREIPKRLRSSSFALPDLDDGEAAWPMAETLAVIKSLEGTLVAIASVRMFERVQWGFEPIDSAWTGDRLRGELNSEYAWRTRVAAADFVQTFDGDTRECIFVLGFPVAKDAA
jgi:hypothetical protein